MIFISHASRDEEIARRVCERLESDGVRCWVSFRDIPGGSNWDDEIAKAFDDCQALVLIWSSSAAASENVQDELRLARDTGVPILPLRIEAHKFSKGFRLYLSRPQWIDATQPPLESHLDRLAATVQSIIAGRTTAEDSPAFTAPAKSAARRLLLALGLTLGVVLALAFGYAAYKFYRAGSYGNMSAAELMKRGYEYDEGTNGVNKDPAKAAEFYRKAADLGDADGICQLAICYQYGYGGLAKDEAKAAGMYQTALDKGSAEAALSLGLLYLNGRGGLPQDNAKGVALVDRAAGNGYNPALYALGLYYETGRVGLPVEKSTAAKFYQRAADAGYAPAMVNYALMLREGSGVIPDPPKALEYLVKASNLGNAQAIAEQGWFYEQGLGDLPKDPQKALELYQKSVDMGDPRGMDYLGMAYESGKLGVPKDFRKARELFVQAVQKGDEVAEELLAWLDSYTSSTDKQARENKENK